MLTEEEEKDLPAVQLPRRYIARFEFQRERDTFGSYLSFVPGDTLELVRQIDDNWALGRRGSRQALFPLSFVQELSGTLTSDDASNIDSGTSVNSVSGDQVCIVENWLLVLCITSC